MQIFLQILAIIGIILLCIIGFALLVLGMVLFVPVRYKAKFQKDSEFMAHIQATWLFHFIKFSFTYPEPGKLVICVCGIKLWESETEEQSREPGQEDTSDEKESSDKQVQTLKSRERVEIKMPDREEKNLENQENAATDNGEKNKEQKKEKQNIFQKIQYKIKSIYVKIKKILENLKHYKDVLEEKESRLLFDHCKIRIFKILKHIKPRVIKADVLFGTGEPDTTGYILAIYSMFHPLFEGQINVTPDFEEKILEGRVYIKGRITVMNLLYNFCRIYFDSRLHVLLDKLNRKDV